MQNMEYAIESSQLGFGFFLELTRVLDPDGDTGAATLRSDLLHLGEHLDAFSDLTEDDVSAVKMRSRGEGHEELGAVGVGASVGHGEDSWALMLHLEVLISELGAVDGLATGAVASSEITALSHESRDDTMEGGSLVVEGLAGSTETLFTSAESSEVLGSLGSVSVELHNNTSAVALADADIEVHFSVSHFL